jgi:hypothetical protein
VHVFGDFLVTAVEESNVGYGGVDDFTIQFQDQAQHAVSGWMGWAHVQHHSLTDKIVSLRVVVIRSARSACDVVWGVEFFGCGTHAVLPKK